MEKRCQYDGKLAAMKQGWPTFKQPWQRPNHHLTLKFCKSDWHETTFICIYKLSNFASQNSCIGYNKPLENRMGADILWRDDDAWKKNRAEFGLVDIKKNVNDVSSSFCAYNK